MKTLSLLSLWLSFGVITLVAMVSVACSGSSGSASRLTVGAAASLEPLLRELASAFESQSGVAVDFEFAASGVLAQQIERGAPLDVFVSADSGFVRQLDSRGVLLSDSVRPFGEGRLVLVTNHPVGPGTTWLDVATSPSNRHVAIANPEVAPYGAAALQALQYHDSLIITEPKIVYGEHVTHALQFAIQGSADAAFVSLAQIRASLHGDLDWLAIEPCIHEPIEQTVAIVRDTSQMQAAQAFVAFLVGSEASTLLEAYGYASPGSRQQECAA